MSESESESESSNGNKPITGSETFEAEPTVKNSKEQLKNKKAIWLIAIIQFKQTYFAAAPLVGKHLGSDDVPLIIILTVTIIGVILLALNILLILFFIRRRRKKMEKGKE